MCFNGQTASLSLQEGGCSLQYVLGILMDKQFIWRKYDARQRAGYVGFGAGRNTVLKNGV